MCYCVPELGKHSVYDVQIHSIPCGIYAYTRPAPTTSALSVSLSLQTTGAIQTTIRNGFHW